MRTPSLKAIKTFQIAAKHSSFAVAADELCITPSAVSHQIKTLETQLGLPLFSRAARALALTDAGARYLEQIDDLFMRLEAVTEQLRARYGRNSVRLHVPAYFASEMLLPRLSEFAKLHDGIDLRIETQGVHGRTHAAEADISVVVGTGCTSARKVTSNDARLAFGSFGSVTVAFHCRLPVSSSTRCRTGRPAARSSRDWYSVSGATSPMSTRPCGKASANSMGNRCPLEIAISM